jgi:hypothetical protein
VSGAAGCRRRCNRDLTQPGLKFSDGAVACITSRQFLARPRAISTPIPRAWAASSKRPRTSTIPGPVISTMAMRSTRHHPDVFPVGVRDGQPRLAQQATCAVSVPRTNTMGKTVAAAEKRDEIAVSLEVSPPLRAQADEVIEREGRFLSRFSARREAWSLAAGAAGIVAACCSGHG